MGWDDGADQPDTFRLRFDREGFSGRKTHILIGALHHGDAQCRETVAVATISVGATYGSAKQTIQFSKIANQRAGTVSVPLHAISDREPPVQYFVSWGPTQIVGNTLTLTDLPDRAHCPIALRGTACQWGKSTAPTIDTAAR